MFWQITIPIAVIATGVIYSRIVKKGKPNMMLDYFLHLQYARLFKKIELNYDPKEREKLENEISKFVARYSGLTNTRKLSQMESALFSKLAEVELINS